MSGYEIIFSITAMCPCCGKELPSSHYLTESRPCDGPLSRDNPYERKDRRVFITPCPECFVHQSNADGDQLAKSKTERDELLAVIKDLAWRMNDIRDMLMTRTFRDEALYGCDEWSTPTVNLRTAVSIAEKAMTKATGSAS